MSWKRRYRKEYYQKNKERERRMAREKRKERYGIPEQRKKILEQNREYKHRIKYKALSHYCDNDIPPKCACCGETHIEFLTIDHIHGGGRKHREEVGFGKSFYRWLIKNNFPKGFQVLCYNCNCAKGHFGYCPHKREMFES